MPEYVELEVTSGCTCICRLQSEAGEFPVTATVVEPVDMNVVGTQLQHDQVPEAVDPWLAPGLFTADEEDTICGYHWLLDVG